MPDDHGDTNTSNQKYEYEKVWDEYKYKDPNRLFDRKELLNIAIETRNQELQFFWKRAQFFWVLNAASLGGIGFLTTNHSENETAFIASIFGLITAFSWTLTNRGSKYWYENWKKRIDCETTVKAWFRPAKRSGSWWWRCRLSQSKILIATSDAIVGFWLIISFKLGYSLLVPDASLLGLSILRFDLDALTEQAVIVLVFSILGLCAVLYIFISSVRHHESTEVQNSKVKPPHRGQFPLLDLKKKKFKFCCSDYCIIIHLRKMPKHSESHQSPPNTPSNPGNS